jgi:formyl-CoA transferase
VPAAVVNLNPDALYDDPQVAHEGLLIEIDDPNVGPVRLLNTLIDFERTPGAVTSAGPGLGQHTIEILAEFGFDPDQIASKLARGAAKAQAAPAISAIA